MAWNNWNLLLLAAAALWYFWPLVKGRVAKRAAAGGFLGKLVRPESRPTPLVPSAEDALAGIDLVRRRLVGTGWSEADAGAATENLVKWINSPPRSEVPPPVARLQPGPQPKS